MKYIIDSFNSGDNIVPNKFCDEISSLIVQTDCSSGKQALTEFRNNLPDQLMRLGWSDNVFLDMTSRINITSMREKTGLCVQTGNASRVYADLMKLQTLFVKNTILNGIFILPTAQTGRIIGQNVASYDRVIREMPIFKQVITLPLVIIGYEV